MKVQSRLVPDGITVQEASCFRIIHAGAVVVEAGFGIVLAAGEEDTVAQSTCGGGGFVAVEPVAVAAVSGVDGRFAIGTIDIRLDDGGVFVYEGFDGLEGVAEIVIGVVPAFAVFAEE